MPAPQPPSEEQPTAPQLVARFQAGDRSAAGTLLRRHMPRVREIGRIRLGAAGPLRRTMDSEDLLQETMIRALGGLDRLSVESEGQFIAWLAKIVENTARDANKHQHVQKRDLAREGYSLDDVEHGCCADEPSPSRIAMGQEMEARYHEALDAMPEKHREVIVLRNHVGLGYPEIATQLGLPTPDAVRALFSRALSALARHLDCEGES